MSLFRKLKSYGKNIAIIDEDLNTYTYNELLKSAKTIGKKITKDTTTFLISNNSYEFVASYIGLIQSKAVLFLINNSINKEKLTYLINHYKPKYILSPKEKEKILLGLKETFSLNEKFKLFETKFKKKQKVYKNLALLMTTSGSTGSPKFVKLSYSNISDNANKIAQFLNIKSTDRPITTMQPSYSYGLSIINSHLIKGASIIMTECTLFEKKFWEIFKKKKATTFGGVPYIYEILKKLKFNKMNLPSLKYITQAGGKLNKTLLKDFVKISKEKKIKFYIMYGQTEATARMSYLDYKLIEKKIGSIGKPLPGGSFYICDDKNKMINKKKTTGELIYKGKNVMLGYAECIEDLKKGDVNKKKLFTGDLATIDADGFYYITGRKSRYLKIFGIRLNLDEIEQQIMNQGIECACMGKDDNLNIFVTSSCKINFLSRFLSHNLGINKTAFSINVISKIPRNIDGKILYSYLKKKKI